MTTQKRWLWVFAVLIFMVVNALIVSKELMIANGQTLYLQLAPVDPRSLMQGDFMRLRYAISNAAHFPAGPGYMVIRIDKNHVGQFVRLQTDLNAPLAVDEYLLKYRGFSGGVHIGAESFLFQEGQGREYAQAEYAELRLADNGTVLLVGLLDEHFNVLGEPIH